MRRYLADAALALAVLALAACGDWTEPTAPETPGPGGPAEALSSDAAVLVGAGDIAGCGTSGNWATARLLDTIPGTIFAAGDNTYPTGSLQQYQDCYNPSWGRHKGRTRPAPGNHEYNTSGAAGYFTYFGAAAGSPDRGYYSYDLGAWHIIVLNSELPTAAGSPQEQWLRRNLANHPTLCTLAYWHRPRFSSGGHGNDSGMKPLWDALYEYGAEVVLNGHDHDYERFAPQTPGGRWDGPRGIREFVVGTGGHGLGSFYTVRKHSIVRYNHTYGVLKLTLRPDRYSWRFVPTAGHFADHGTTYCH